MAEHLVILGASYAGFQLASEVRKGGFPGAVTLIGAEPGLPYQRPPLSKAFLQGDMAEDRLPMTGWTFFNDENVRYLPGVQASSLDTQARTLVLSTGEELAYSWLAFCTGARARRLPVAGADLPGVYTMRSLADARAIKNQLASSRSVCVIGAGFIGLEVAAACRQAGKTVTVVEAGEEVLARALPQPLRRYLQARHEAAGVTFRFSTQVQAIAENEPAGGLSVVTDNGALPCDTVIVGIGATPNTELAAAAGIHCDPAIPVDAFGRTQVDRVLAAGDCASYPCDFAPTPGTRMTLESVQAAKDTARAVASVILGNPQPFNEVPWFWTDQYDLKVQMAGLCSDRQEYVLRGDPAESRFSWVGLQDGTIRSVFSVNRPADHMAARKLIAQQTSVAAEQAADTNTRLKALINSVRE